MANVPYGLTNAKTRPTQDTSITGARFHVYHVRIESGLTTDRPAFVFAIAGPASLPTPQDLWEDWIKGMQTPNAELFLDYLRELGYVEIAEVTSLVMSY